MGSNWDSEAGLGLIIDIHATGRVFVEKLGPGISLDIANSVRNQKPATPALKIPTDHNRGPSTGIFCGKWVFFRELVSCEVQSLVLTHVVAIALQIRPGDEILEVDSLPIFGKKTSELRKLMRGPHVSSSKLRHDEGSTLLCDEIFAFHPFLCLVPVASISPHIPIAPWLSLPPFHPQGSRVMLTLQRGGVRILVTVTRVSDTDGTPHGFGKENLPSESSALRHGFTEAELVKAKSDLEKKLQQELRAAHEERVQRLEEDMVKSRQQHMQNLQNDMEKWRGQHIEQLQESMREV